MNSMRSTKIIYWTSTLLIFLWEGLMPALTFHTDLAKQGISHLGYPPYFGNVLVVFKVLGALALLIPKVPSIIKEWAYACFAVLFLFASISHYMVDGLGFQTLLPLLFLGVLIASNQSFHQIELQKSRLFSSQE